jgi:hypothetical protein
MKKFKLERTKQCKKCPWRKSTNPHDIPNGYCEVKHQNLEKTIAKPGEFNLTKINAMACHESNEQPQYCIGWLHNQLGVGNNIGLRIKMIHCENAKDIKIFGEQHSTFEDTLPQ